MKRGKYPVLMQEDWSALEAVRAQLYATAGGCVERGDDCLTLSRAQGQLVLAQRHLRRGTGKQSAASEAAYREAFAAAQLLGSPLAPVLRSQVQPCLQRLVALLHAAAQRARAGREERE